MITSETVERIWKCQRELRVGKDMLEEMKRISENLLRDNKADRIKDAFGRERDLQLGIPSGDHSHMMLNVSPVLAVSIIRAHIANKEAELIEANERARIELEERPAEGRLEVCS